MIELPAPPKECGDVFARLSEYLDGELHDDLCARIAAHIEGCGPCVEFVESLRRARDLCRRFESPERPAALTAGLREELRAALQEAIGAAGR